MKPEQGVLSILQTATSPDVKNGCYYGPNGSKGDPQELKPVIPINVEMEDELFKVSEELTKENFKF